MKFFFQRHAIPLLLLLLPAILFHEKILFRGWILCGGDMINQFVPWREFAIQEIMQGRFPFWNPYVFCGTPFAANIQTSLFYPFNLLNFIFSIEWTFSLSLVFHHILSLLTMYAFLYKTWESKSAAVLGSLIYGWSGFFVTHSSDGHLIHTRAYAYIPLILWLQPLFDHHCNLRRVFLFSLCLAAMFYAGHTQIPLYIFYLVFFRAAWWGIHTWRKGHNFRTVMRPPIATLGGLGLSLLLSALVLIPLYQFSQHTAERAGGARYEFATSDSMPPSHLLTYFAPFFYGDPTSEAREAQFWETRTGYHEICGYAGVLPWLLLCFAFLSPPSPSPAQSKKRWEFIFFLLVLLVGLFFALGKYNPLYPLLYYGLPGWSFFRVPGRLVLLVILGISVCAARGWVLWKEQDWKTIKNARSTQAAVILTALWIIFTFILLLSKPALLTWLREFEVDRTISEYRLWNADRNAISRQLPQILFETRYAYMLFSSGLACGFFLLGWFVLWAGKQAKAWLKWLPVFLLLVELLWFSFRFFPVKSFQEWNETYYPQTELVTFLQENTSGYRVLCLDDAIGAPNLETHPELRPNRLMRYGIETVRGYDPLILQRFTRYVNKMFDQPHDDPQGGLLFFPEIPPNKYLNILNVRLIITSQSLSQPYTIAWEEPNSELKVYQNPNAFPRFFWKDSPQSTSFSLEKKTPTLTSLILPPPNNSRTLVYSQTAYPPWTAHIHNKSIQSKTYEDSFLAMQVPASNELPVGFQYKDHSFVLGLGITLFTFLAGLAFCLPRRKLP